MASYADRTCPNCGASFTPRRIDQYFCQIPCKDALYQREYRALFFDFPKALLRQAFACAFCGGDGSDGSLRPLIVDAYTDDHYVVAVCQPCKRNRYVGVI